MIKTIQAEDVRKVVREAFKDVTKGESIGVREAVAMDDYADEDARLQARAEDTEEHWWDIPRQWQEQLPEALSFTDTQGFRFFYRLRSALRRTILSNTTKHAGYDATGSHSAAYQYLTLACIRYHYESNL